MREALSMLVSIERIWQLDQEEKISVHYFAIACPRDQKWLYILYKAPRLTGGSDGFTGGMSAGNSDIYRCNSGRPPRFVERRSLSTLTVKPGNA